MLKNALTQFLLPMQNFGLVSISGLVSKLFGLAWLSFALCLPVQAQQRLPLEFYMKNLPECVHGDGGALCNGAIQRYHEQIAKKQLQHQYQQVLALISTTHQDTQGVSYLDDQRLVEALKAQHKAWPKFMDAECELIGALSDGMSTWQSVRAVECERNLTEQRLKRFKHARACLEKIEPAKRLQEAKSCLYQLAPLAVPLKP